MGGNTLVYMNISTRITHVVLVMAGIAVIPLLSSCSSSKLFGGKLFRKKDAENIAENADVTGTEEAKVAAAADPVSIDPMART